MHIILGTSQPTFTLTDRALHQPGPSTALSLRVYGKITKASSPDAIICTIIIEHTREVGSAPVSQMGHQRGQAGGKGISL